MWHIHGVGIESGEEAVDPLTEGAVIAYEPTLEVGPDAFYLEDMILVTATGHRVLSADLPYTSGALGGRPPVDSLFRPCRTARIPLPP